MLKFKRLYPGRYRARAKTELRKKSLNGEIFTRNVEVEINIHRVAPREFGESGEPWWRIDVETVEANDEDIEDIASGGDLFEMSYREAKASAEAAVTNGWTWMPGLGWCG